MVKLADLKSQKRQNKVTIVIKKKYEEDSKKIIPKINEEKSIKK